MSSARVAIFALTSQRKFEPAYRRARAFARVVNFLVPFQHFDELPNLPSPRIGPLSLFVSEKEPQAIPAIEALRETPLPVAAPRKAGRFRLCYSLGLGNTAQPALCTMLVPEVGREPPPGKGRSLWRGTWRAVAWILT